jgi:WD40 repeat protein
VTLGSRNDLASVDFSLAGSFLTAASLDGQIRIWDYRSHADKAPARRFSIPKGIYRGNKTVAKKSVARSRPLPKILRHLPSTFTLPSTYTLPSAYLMAGKVYG